MTNYEAIMSHKEEFEKWVKGKDGIDDVLRKGFIALVVANCIECDECPVMLECFMKDRKPCLECMKDLLNEEYRGELK